MSSADRPSGASVTSVTASHNQAGAAVDEAGLDAQARRAIEFVRMLLGKMSMDAEVSVPPDDGEGGEDEIRLEIEGPDAGRIIGKRGQVLEAIQYLTTRIAHRPGEAAPCCRRRRRGIARVTRTSSRRWRRSSRSE